MRSSDLHRALVSPRVVGLADQLFFSLGALFQVVMLARHLPVREFGIFSIAMSLTLLAQSLHRSVVVLPMTVSLAGTEQLEHRGWLSVGGGVITVAMVSLASLGTVLSLDSSVQVDLAAACWMAVVSVPAYLIYEHARRCLFAVRDGSRIWLTSAIHASGQAFAVVLVVVIGGSVFTAVAGLAAAAAMAAGVGLRSASLTGVKNARRGGCELIRAHGSAMAWNTAAAVPYAGYNAAVPALLGALVGPLAAASFAATRLALAPITSLIGAIDSVDKPRAATSLRTGGASCLRSSLSRTGLTLLLLGLPYLLVVATLGAPLLVWLLGADYADAVHALPIWAVAGLMMLAGQPVETGLLVLQRARWYFWARCLAAVVALLTLTLGAPILGFSAGVVAVVAGWFVAGVVGALMLVVAMRTHRAPSVLRK